MKTRSIVLIFISVVIGSSSEVSARSATLLYHGQDTPAAQVEGLCKGGVSDACLVLASDAGMAKEYDRQLAFGKLGCKAGDSASCSEAEKAAMRLHRHSEMKQLAGQHRAAMAKTCENATALTDYMACIDLAKKSTRKEDKERYGSKAFYFFKARYSQRQDRASLTLLISALYASGKTEDADSISNDAIEQYSKECRNGDRAACSALRRAKEQKAKRE